MSTLNNKYKDKLPEETIENIKKFFKSKNLNLTITKDIKSIDSNTWSCRVELLNSSGDSYLGSNGKGTTKEFSQASGCAEAYERFCNYNNNKCYCNPLFTRKLIETNLIKKGYRFHPEEKDLTYEDIMSIFALNKFYLTYLDNDENVKTFFDIITDGKYIGIPYKKIDNENIKHYYDPRILARAITTIGMAAGNSIDEALNQGLSEIFESYVTDSFYDANLKQLYLIDEKYIKNEELLNIIHKIKNSGFELFLADLSYNFNVPVVASILINKYNYNTSINFGSFPVIDIALERVLTELYQGIDTYRVGRGFAPQIPYKTFDYKIEMLEHLNNRTEMTMFSEELLLNAKFVNYNKNIFIEDKNISNTKLKKYYINLLNELGFNAYYIETSQDENIKAVQIFVEELELGLVKGLAFANTSPILKKEALHLLKLFNILPLAIILNLPYENILEELSLFLKTNDFNGTFIGNLTFDDWGSPLVAVNKNALPYLFQIINFINNDPRYGLQVDKIGKFSDNLKYYNFIRTYIDSNNYNQDEIKNFLSLFTNRETIEEDIKNIYNKEYLFKKMYIEPLREIWNSPELEEMVNYYI